MLPPSYLHAAIKTIRHHLLYLAGKIVHATRRVFSIISAHYRYQFVWQFVLNDLSLYNLVALQFAFRGFHPSYPRIQVKTQRSCVVSAARALLPPNSAEVGGKVPNFSFQFFEFFVGTALLVSLGVRRRLHSSRPSMQRVERQNSPQ